MANNDLLFLGKLEARISNLEYEIERIRNWRHDLPNQLIIPLQNDIEDLKNLIINQKLEQADSQNESNRIIRLRDIFTFVAGIASCYTVLHLIGLIK